MVLPSVKYVDDFKKTTSGPPGIIFWICPWLKRLNMVVRKVNVFEYLEEVKIVRLKKFVKCALC